MQLLRELLQRIHAGETNFDPASHSEEDIENFQRVANRLLEAKNRNLIHDVKMMKSSSRGRLYFETAIVIGGLTFQGEQFLEASATAAPEKHVPQEGHNSLDIFISHASEDRDSAESLINLLRSALPVDPTRIRCTSVQGYRLPAGSSFNDQLRAEVFESTALVALLSPASLQSTYTLFELGARWGAGKYLAPILIKETSVQLLQQPLSSLNAVSSNSESDVSQLLSDLAKALNMQAHPFHSYASALQAFCR